MAGALFQINGNPMLHIPTRPTPKRSLLSPTPAAMVAASMTENQSYWSTINIDLHAYLKQAIAIRPPLSVFEPMHRLTFAAPETAAPALCLAACELVGGRRSQAMAAAAAIHLMHAAAAAHEHLPLTNIELLTGDGMVPFGFEVLARSDDPARDISGRVLRVIAEISRAAGSQGMVEGQYRKLQGENLCMKKEGELHACGGSCGAILGGGSEEEVERLRKFGMHVGMVRGMLQEVGRNEEEVEELRNLAMEELRDFGEDKVEAVSRLLDLVGLTGEKLVRK